MSALDRYMTEAQLQETVISMAEVLGWLTWHDHDSRRNDPGFPDLVLVNPYLKRVLWLELKTEKGRVRTAQQVWIDTLMQAGERAYIIRPRDLNRVEQLLRGEV